MISYLKRVTGGKALSLQHEFELVVKALDLEDRIQILVE